MVIRVKKHADPARRPRYRFSTRPPAPAKPQEAPAAPPAEDEAARDALRNVPPDIPFLRFDAIVGRGGMAVVWRAWHQELGRYVAVKVLDRNFAATGKDVRQFMLEVRTMTDLHHPGIVQGYGADCADGRYYFIMDYVDGYTLGSLLARGRRLPQADALIVCESVADAMMYAWNDFGIVHCDLKPENLMVDRDGTVKVTDLGLCQSTSAIKQAGQAEEVVGTPAYISPEQIYGDAELDCRADIYSLGATLYHLVTGRMLFPLLSNDDILRAHVDPERRAPDPRTLEPALSEGFCRLLERMLVKDRAARFQSWAEVLEAARRVEGGGDLPPLPSGAASSVAVGVA